MKLPSVAGVAGRYVIASLISFCISAGGPVIGHELLGLKPEWSVGASYVIVLCTNFFIGKFFVYRSQGNMAKEAISFLGTSFLFRGLEYGAFILIYTFSSFPYFLINIFILGTSSVLKFLVFKHFVYKTK